MALTITVVDNVTSVEVVEEVITITEATAGPQGPTGATGVTGATGATGATGSSGVIGVTAPITNSGTSTAAQIGIDQTALTIAATQVTGTAYTTTRKKIDDSALASSLDIVPRTLVQAARSLSSGQIYYTLFTPSENFTLANFTVYCTTGGTDSGGTTVRRMGLYTTSGTNNTSMTLVARTASDATIGNTAGTSYTRALNTTGGYPSTYNLVAGTTYAFAIMCYNTGGTYGQPSFAGHLDFFPQLTPYRILSNSGQTDLPATVTAQSVGGASAVFSRLT